jgi:HAMP domain
VFSVFTIARPMRALSASMEERAGGNFGVVLPGLGRKDEVGAVAGAVESSRRLPSRRPARAFKAPQQSHHSWPLLHVRLFSTEPFALPCLSLINPISGRIKTTTKCCHLTADEAKICRMFLNYQRFWTRWRSLGESNPCFSLERAAS